MVSTQQKRDVGMPPILKSNEECLGFGFATWASGACIDPRRCGMRELSQVTGPGLRVGARG